MEDQNAFRSTRARKPARTEGYARLWKAIISGAVPNHTEDVDSWYRAAQHCIGLCMHEAHLETLTRDGSGSEHAPVDLRQAA
jgi:hypothetical protein